MQSNAVSKLTRHNLMLDAETLDALDDFQRQTKVEGTQGLSRSEILRALVCGIHRACKELDLEADQSATAQEFCSMLSGWIVESVKAAQGNYTSTPNGGEAA